ncbi:MAG: SDR family oxidoreductase [Alphaproteobacteria bacterium]|nr:SDR family oxidoreductase [Alphaproteobacteria bacterium]
MGELQDRVAIVTGAGSGIGQAVAEVLAREGAYVIVVDRDGPSVERIVLAIRARGGASEGIEVDITDRRCPDQLADRLAAGGRRIDILVNNVGGSIVSAPVLSISDDDWDRVLDLNLLAATRLDRKFVPMMVEQGSGAVVHVASVAGRIPLANIIPYCTAKAALRMYSKALAQSIAADGVRVNCMLPGFIETQGAAGLIDRVVESAGVEREEARRTVMNMLGRIPAGRAGRPEEAGEMIAFMVSDRASFMFGAEVPVDGGTISMI